MSSFRDKLRPYKRLLQNWVNGAPTDFDPQTLPWIDRDDADINAFLNTFQQPAGYKYDLKEKLQFWRENGYVILEGAIPAEWCDKLWEEVEYTIDHHQNFGIKSLTDKVNNNKDIAIRDVPKEKLRGIGSRLNDYHHASITCKKLLSHTSVATFLQAVFNEPIVAFQTLIFKYGSQQGVHQDFPWVTSGIASHLAAAWIALEDITEDAGPLFYYPGSHRLKKFDFGNGILYKDGESLHKPTDFERYLENICAKEGIEKKTLTLKKGDLLVWHAALAHGGTRITSDPAKTRKSLVVHYSSRRAYPTSFRYGVYDPPVVEEHNGIAFYQHPQRPEEENVLKMGETWQE
jgi:phytanoyl-CoA hydroxylase